jgi:hypothetical protein
MREACKKYVFAYISSLSLLAAVKNFNGYVAQTTWAR